MGAAAPPAQAVAAGPDDAALARRELRRQVARLERELAAAFVTAWTGGGLECEARARSRRTGPPRLLDLGELEAVRDDLVARLAAARSELARRAREAARARRRLELILRDPAAHRFARVTCAELGEPGCGAWEVRPRMGLIGIAIGWWQVKLSSGCPLPGAV